MSGFDSGAHGSSSGSQDFELNLAPIIDCLTVLITFMLISFTVLSIGILDAGVSAASAASQTQDKPPRITLQLDLQSDFSFNLKVSGQKQFKKSIARSGDQVWNYEGLNRELASLKTEFPEVDALTLSASDDVAYVHVIKSMDQVRKTLPAVLLGGF